MVGGTLYSQRDPRWSGKQLGSCADTLGQSGCLDTVFAMVSSDFGTPYDPAAMSDTFSGRGVYVNGCLLTDDALAKVVPNLEVRVFDFANGPADLSLLDAAGSDPHTQVIVKISTAAVPSHFMRVAAAWASGDPNYEPHNAGSIDVDDPWTGQRSSFGDTFGGSDPKTSIVKVIYYTQVFAVPLPTVPFDVTVRPGARWYGTPAGADQGPAPAGAPMHVIEAQGAYVRPDIGTWWLRATDVSISPQAPPGAQPSAGSSSARAGALTDAGSLLS